MVTVGVDVFSFTGNDLFGGVVDALGFIEPWGILDTVVDA